MLHKRRVAIKPHLPGPDTGWRPRQVCDSVVRPANPDRARKMAEAPGGFEPPNRGFADLRLSPLGYGATFSYGPGPGVPAAPRGDPGPPPGRLRWCRGGDSNSHSHKATAPSTLRVYQFRHLGAPCRVQAPARSNALCGLTPAPINYSHGHRASTNAGGPIPESVSDSHPHLDGKRCILDCGIRAA